ncbi:MAG: hypothetical protein ACREDN_10320, partial [Aestuariivirga sp.]
SPARGEGNRSGVMTPSFSLPSFVIAGLVPATHNTMSQAPAFSAPGVAGINPAMTNVGRSRFDHLSDFRSRGC